MFFMKNTKIRLACFLFLLQTAWVQAQEGFDQFVNQSQIETVVVNKKMFQMMANVKTDPSDPSNIAYVQLIKKLDVLKTFKTKNATKAAQLQTAMMDYVKKNQMEELLQTTDQGKHMIFYVNKAADRKNINEMFMWVDASSKGETSIMYITGAFALDELSALTSKMNLNIAN